MKQIQFAFAIGSILLTSSGKGKKLKAANTSNEELAGQINGLQAKDNLNKVLEEKGTSMKQIRDKAEAAIHKFEDAGSEVVYKNVLEHINFQDKCFFKSGSSTVGVKGREALNIVAEVLRENPGVSVILVGNADTAHVKVIADNWTLNTEKANAEEKVLHDLYNINPSRLIAAGKGKYNPVVSNDTPRERGKTGELKSSLIQTFPGSGSFQKINHNNPNYRTLARISQTQYNTCLNFHS